MAFRDPGELRERVILQSEQRAADSIAGAAVTWLDGASFAAKIEPKFGREPVVGEALQDEQNYLVTVRYRSAVTPAQRLLWGTTVLQIRAVMHDPGRVWTELRCAAGAAS